MCVYKVIVAGDYVDADANMCIYKIIVADDYGDADVIYKIIVLKLRIVDRWADTAMMICLLKGIKIEAAAVAE